MSRSAIDSVARMEARSAAVREVTAGRSRVALRLIRATCVLTLLATLPAHAVEFGKVQLVEGVVTLTSPKGRFSNPKSGATIEPGSEVVTAVGAELHVLTADGGYLAIRPDTQVRVEAYGKDEMRLGLAKGAVRFIGGRIAKANPLRSRIELPTAAVRVPAGDFDVLFVPEPVPGQPPRPDQPGSYARSNQGTATIETPLATVDVPQGQTGYVPLTAGATPYLLARTSPAIVKTKNEGRIKARK